MSPEQGSVRVFLESFGCSSNVADGEFMSGCLLEAGFELVDSPEQADVLIYNTCAVKTPTENRTFEILKQAGEMHGKRLVVTGCLPLINPARLKSRVRFDVALGPSVGSDITEAVWKVVNPRSCDLLTVNKVAKPSLLLPRKSLNPVVSIVPVAQGCLGACSYCCVVSARGHLRSHSADDIVKRVKMDLGFGAKEVWLTGQDMAAYGRDIGANLADLVNEVCRLEGDYMVRVGMMTPNMTLSILQDLIKSFDNKHVFKFVHLPVQSGDDRILKRMNRLYSVSQFRNTVEAFRDAFPEVTVATDIICGFPGETEADFARSLSLVEEIKPDVVNISKFFPRPRTAAEKMAPKIASAEVSDRSRRMTNLAKEISLAKNKAWLNWEGRVLIDECGKRPGTFIGRNSAYKPIVVKSNSESLLGTFVNVKVAKTYQTYLEAEVTD